MNSHLPTPRERSIRVDPAATDASRPAREAGPSERLAAYLALHGSTTFFLQTVSGSSVEVEVVGQSVEPHPDRGDVLHRRSRLYVRHADNILLLAESTIALSFFDADQRRRLIDRTEGIGKVLDPRNLGLLHKHDIETVRIPAPSGLRTACGWAISRHFALSFRGVRCGEIREILNDESLERAG